MGTGGPSHHCIEDIGVMRSFPNMCIVCPGSSSETWKACRTAIIDHDGPVYLRLERDPFFSDVEDLYEKKGDSSFQIGKAIPLREGMDVTVIGIGKPLALALQAADALAKEGISTRVIKMHTVKPIDRETVERAAAETRGIVTVEEHNTVGGLGEAITSAVCESAPTTVRKVGICEEFCCIGPTNEIWERYGVSVERIIQAARSIMDWRHR
jgi:transketolase